MTEAQIDSGCLSLFLFNRERAVFEGDPTIDTRACKWKTTDIFGMLRTRISIEKTIEPALARKLLFAVPMKINNCPNSLVFVKLCDELLDTGYLRKTLIFVVNIPLPV